MKYNTTLQKLRENLNDTQKQCLNLIWNNYWEKRIWHKKIILHHQVGKQKTLDALNSLGGTIVYETQDYYQLTLLGILLTDECSGAEKLIIEYLNLLKSKFMINPDIEEITSEEVKSELHLDNHQTDLLKEILKDSPFTSGGSWNTEEWNFRLPRNIDDILEIEDIQSYVSQTITKCYDPDCPVINKYFYYIKNDNEQKTFWFIKNKTLNDLLLKDWDEVQTIFNARAWKSCVILCGSMLEGLLQDILSQYEIKHKAEFAQLPNKPKGKIKEWTLADLVEISFNCKIISKSTSQLGHAVREYRNLIHPEKQIRSEIIVSEEQASIAYNFVKLCIKELSQFCLR